MTKLCPECDKHYDDEDLTHCPEDDTRLISLKSQTLGPGDCLDGRFEILRHLGEGGMGHVYLARQLNVERDVAIKVIKPGQQDEVALKRFFREARTTSALTHPNTIRVFDFGQSPEGLVYIVMEYLQGNTFKEVLALQRPIRPGRVAHILAQACDSLSEAHGLGIIHRDLKPDNIFIKDAAGQRDFVKILDFGIAKFGATDSAATLSGSGQIVGTPFYMAPEMISGKDATTSVDIYALAAILYEALAGQPPFIADSPVGVMFKQIAEAPPSLAHLPYMTDALHDFIIRALSKDLHVRPPTVLAFKDELLKNIPQDAEGVHFSDDYNIADGADTMVSSLAGLTLQSDTSNQHALDPSTGPHPTLETDTEAPQDSPPAQEPSTEPKTPPEPPTPQPSTSKRLIFIVLASMMIAVTVGLIAFWPSSKAEQPAAPKVTALMLVAPFDKDAQDSLWLVQAAHASLTQGLSNAEGIRLVTAPEEAELTLTLTVQNQNGMVVLDAAWSDSGRPGLRTEPTRIHMLYAEIDWLAVQIRTALGEVDAAPLSYAGLLKIRSPNAYTAWLAMGRAFRDELPQTANEHLNKAIEADPGFVLAQVDHAYWSNYHYGDLHASRETLQEVARSTTDDHPFISLYVRVIQAYLDSDNATLVSLLDEMTRRFPGEGLYYNMLFDELETKREYAAFTRASEALKVANPIYAGSRYLRDRSIMLSYEGEHDEALSHLERYIATRPWLVTSYQDQGDLLRNAGRYDAAIEAYERAISIAPSNWLHMYIANVLFRQGKALAAIQRVTPSFNTDDVFEMEEALMILLDIGYEVQDPYGIVEREIAPRLAGTSKEDLPIAHAFVAVFEDRLDEATRGARAALESGLTTWRHYYAYWLLLEVMIAKKQPQLALNQVDKVCRDMEIGWYAVDDCHLLHANTMIRLDLPQQALEHLEKAHAYNPNRGRTLFLMGLAHEKLGDTESARKSYTRFLELWPNADPGLLNVKHADLFLKSP